MSNKYQKKFLKNTTQMYRIDATGKFAEFISPTPDFQKITLNICAYNKNAPQGKRMGKKDTCYFDIPYFLELCRAIANNEIYIKAQNAGDYDNIAPELLGINDHSWWKFTIERSKIGVFLKIYTGEVSINNRGERTLSQCKTPTSIATSWQALYEMAAICKVRVEALIFRMEMLGMFDYKPENITDAPPAPLPLETKDNPPAPNYINEYADIPPHYTPAQDANNIEEFEPRPISDYGDGGFYDSDDLPFRISS